MKTSHPGIQACFQALKVKETDPFKKLWASLDTKGKRLFLAIAGVSPLYAGKAWDELSADVRGQIKRRASDLKEWLNTVLPEAA